jgi:hypothetical protein
MNKKIIISLLVIILLLTILCLKISLFEFFTSRENIEKEVRQIFTNCPHINNINFNDIDSMSMTDFSNFDENTISGLTKCYEDLSIEDQSNLMKLVMTNYL